MRRMGTICGLGTALLLAVCAYGDGVAVEGQVFDPQGKGVAGGRVSLVDQKGALAGEALTSESGAFCVVGAAAGWYTIRVEADGFSVASQTLAVPDTGVSGVVLRFTEVTAQRDSVTVTADLKHADIEYPDPATKVFVRDQVLDANPGRPGAPISIPGYPIETASSGIKAPQYFAPGVAGDHGEPIATFFEAGSYLVPNNLSANAHGNGYSDPNMIIPQIIESVQVDGGAFNVREGNHAVNLAEIYGFHERLMPVVTLTGDAHDVDLTAGWSPEKLEVREFFALQVSYGNGFLARPEHRQQYKFNAFRVFDFGSHQLTLLGLAYYGFSYVAGLVPVGIPGLNDSIDRRQRDQTHTGELVLNDIWKAAPGSEVQSSAFFRTYNLSLYSNFGDGLIRQSEFRTVAGGNETYVRKVNDAISVMAGVDYLRDAPRRLDLDHYDPFEKVTANNVTLNFIAPYIALEGHPFHWLRYYLGWRRDLLDADNQDLLHPVNSFHRWDGINSPKATLSLIAPESSVLPSASFSFGETFFSNDPRTGTGGTVGTLVSRAHSAQLVVFKSIGGTEVRVTLGRVTQEQSLAKIDPDTGLQFNEGPGRNYFMTAAARHFFTWGSLQGSVSKADARDVSNGTPLPEAPRLIVDFVGTLDRLPFHLHARAEYEQVGRKPLGDGFTGVAVKEFRGALVRPFLSGRLDAGINFLIASGYTGQTTEVLALAGEGAPFERVVGVALPSYASVSVTYHFGPRAVGVH